MRVRWGCGPPGGGGGPSSLGWGTTRGGGGGTKTPHRAPPHAPPPRPAAPASSASQAARSRYREAEIALGGALARHDLRVVQTGRDTRTALRCFCLVGPGQCHDLHSQVLLDHPGAVVDQLHKQIAAAPSSRGVFDGNIRVARAAQRADAAQLTRSLLLRRGATVNARPNLQIVADDVKCAHGCTVSDLDAEELFYLRARGLTEAQAREALVFSFGCEVLEKVGDGAWGDVTARLQDRIRGNLVGTVGVGE